MDTVKIVIYEHVTPQVHECNFFKGRTIDNFPNLPALLYLANTFEHLSVVGWVNLLMYSQPASMTDTE